MIAQTTDSGGNNGTMAAELALIFAAADDPVYWPYKTMQIKCYAHKLALGVKHSLQPLGLHAAHTKPNTQPFFNIPTPSIVLNDGDEDADIESDHGSDTDSDPESDSAAPVSGDPEEPDSEDDDDPDELPEVLPPPIPAATLSGSSRPKPDLVVQATIKVSSTLLSLL